MKLTVCDSNKQTGNVNTLGCLFWRCYSGIDAIDIQAADFGAMMFKLGEMR